MALLPALAQRLEHGGSLARGKRKTARPIATKRAMHLVLRSTRAKGRHSLLQKRNARYLDELASRLSASSGVRIYEVGNGGNHVHLLVQAKTRPGFARFLRLFAGHLAQFVTGARKGRPFGKFWDAPAFSRLVQWGKAFAVARAYVVRNRLEGLGLIPYSPRPRHTRRNAPSG